MAGSIVYLLVGIKHNEITSQIPPPLPFQEPANIGEYWEA